MNHHIETIVIDSLITKVTYGLNDQVIDITDRFLKIVHNNDRLQVTNQFAGIDPLYGIVKKLYIFTANGNHFDITEGHTVIIKMINRPITIPKQQTVIVNINITRLVEDENSNQCQKNLENHLNLLDDLILFKDI
jgi:hypothetical protein